MSSPALPRGSEWRKWDLHIHSPASILNNQFVGVDEADKWNSYVAKLESLGDTAVLGITDYFSIRGYQKLKEIKDGGRLRNIALLLPNVELRILPVTDADHPINLHFIFSPTIVGAVESMFFQNLDFSVDGNTYKCTRADLVRLGQKHDATLAGEDAQYREGVNQFKVTPDQLRQVLKDNKDLAKNCVVAVANSSRDGNSGIQASSLAATRQEIYRIADIIFSGNPADVDYFLGRGTDSPTIIAAKYGRLKPCARGSDAHKLEHIGVADQDRFTWIKADPTFQGLRQILNEPEDRVFIGALPPSLSQQAGRPTKVMREISIRKTADAATLEKWFDAITLPLNPEMIAIIGNKGSGKSALADILGLTGNTTRHAAFSFLTGDRFRNEEGLAEQFEACLRWAAPGADTWNRLDQNPQVDAVERVKYIPQRYLEQICSELVLGKKSPFYAELEQVIFSHVAPADRLRQPTLAALLEHRGKEINEAIGLLVGELWEQNRSIAVLEEKLADKHRKTLKGQLDEKRRELVAHESGRPKDRTPPAQSPESAVQSQRISAELDKKREDVKAAESAITEASAMLAVRAQEQAKAEKLLTKLDNLEHYVSSFKRDIEADLRDLKLKFSDVVSLSVTRTGINEVLEKTKHERADLESKLDPKAADSLEAVRQAAANNIAELEAQLDAPQKEYQAYIDALKTWEDQKNAMAGDEESPETVAYLEKQIADLDAIPAELKTLYQQRTRKILEIFKEKGKLRGYYRTYYGEVQRFLAEHELAGAGQFSMTFNVSVAESGFADGFLKRINQRKVGSFSSTENGAERIKQLVGETNFDSALQVVRFVKKIQKLLLSHSGRAVQVADQLRQGESVLDLYKHIFSLAYLEPRYSLQWDGKGLEQLSPGERGNLLLIFFLLVDKDDRPLVIDQPEENLDNQTVFRTLVPCIKNAKRRRQIVLVTHNPNLAVVCDAEQVIYSQINKKDDNEVVYETGSLENPGVIGRVVDVLEGTRPAFDKRDDKYLG